MITTTASNLTVLVIFIVTEQSASAVLYIIHVRTDHPQINLLP